MQNDFACTSLLLSNVMPYYHIKSENSGYIKLLFFPISLFLLFSSIHTFSCLSCLLSSSTSLRHYYFYPSLLSYSSSLTYKRTQQHKIVHYSVTVVVVFLFHFSLCMPCKEKMLLYALTPSTILKQKKYLQKEA